MALVAVGVVHPITATDGPAPATVNRIRRTLNATGSATPS
jgi:hypothetical protein